ncbi:hypothetical protein EW145_g452 [Phellinidium pouzarii]|uniref:Beta-mannosidase B n=1 Tax=Phellinidium pouzarii TaxID=167371 RepID=A0A4S4LIS8_9AGAM|nr:hypothetical protein EW145_g452 [Phellinidium pouzarii]
MKSTITLLDKGWTFTQLGGGKGTSDGEWIACKHFPTSVHVELRERAVIPDPFVGLKEWDVQWVGEAEWAFKTIFDVDSETLSALDIDLIFTGLDTYCIVELNGNNLTETNNQFITYRVPAKKALKVGSNELVLIFPSSFIKGRELEAQHGKLGLWNGDSSRLHVRKAQYNYGWDWGPVLMTIGPWRSISMHAYNSHIADIRAVVNVKEDLSVRADLTFKAKGVATGLKANYALLTADRKKILSDSVALKDGEGKTFFEGKPGVFDLWYPVGYGKQPLYTIEVTIFDEQGNVIDVQGKRVGLRRVRVVQDELEDQPGHSFLFEVNNIRIFCGGSNWIPADSFLTTHVNVALLPNYGLICHSSFQNDAEEYTFDVFAEPSFNLISELGILVWQDFMFGCGQYPAYDSFVASVEVEAEQNVKRLRHHPSVVIFAGNNEDYQIAESLKLDLDYDDEQSDFRNTSFPARFIYERLLPAAVSRNSEVHYHRSSPYSGFGQITTDRTNGDLHQWNVWHGSQEPWHNWDILAGRFVSEFGMEGYPNIRTVDYWLEGNKSERTNCNHNKADGFERRLELYLIENFNHAFDMESYIYYTQVMQAETLASAYRLWRRNWKGRGKEYTAGALVWQINDCWPVTSWAIVDYFLRPKPAFFTIARELRPITVGMTRKEKKVFAHEHKAAEFIIDTEIEIWGTNSGLVEKSATLSVTSFDLESEWTETWTKDIVLAPNASTELWKGSLSGQPTRTKLSDVPKPIVVSARILDGDAVLSRYSNWPEPFKYIHFPSVEEAGLRVTLAGDGETIELSCKKPIKGIVLDVDGDDVKWSDQAIDLVPGDSQKVKALGLNGRTVKARYLGDGST